MKYCLPADALGNLLSVLREHGYRALGPTVRNSCIVFDDIHNAADLPQGWTDYQDKGQYRLSHDGSTAFFNHHPGPKIWRRFLDPPERKLFSAEHHEQVIRIIDEEDRPEKLAFIGVRACELKAIQLQDTIYTKGPFIDAHYCRQRESTLIVAVNCNSMGATCFCQSMNTGPKVSAGFDLCLTEVVESSRHFFIVETGSPSGDHIAASLGMEAADASQLAMASEVLCGAEKTSKRALDSEHIKSLLEDNREHPFWDEVAERCLSCANCTLVCPSCFCSTVEDTTGLTGENAERWQKWDSCFNRDFTYIHGGSVRHTTKSRYRQWMSHKLATWKDQFGELGCVGCGRCITWCPVGIDITEIASVFTSADKAENKVCI